MLHFTGYTIRLVLDAFLHALSNTLWGGDIAIVLMSNTINKKMGAHNVAPIFRVICLIKNYSVST